MSSVIRDAVILAAGRGTRMFPLTETIPKPMAPFRGGTLISRGIEDLKALDLRIHITVGYKRAALAQHVMELGVDSVINTEGHTNAWFMYRSLLAELRSPFLVLTCDNVTRIDLELLSREYAALGQPACMLVPVPPVAGVDGDYIFQKDHLVVELSRTRPSDTYSSGIQVIHPEQVRRLAPREGDFNTVWQQLIHREALYASTVYPHPWVSVDTIDALEHAESESV